MSIDYDDVEHSEDGAIIEYPGVTARLDIGDVWDEEASRAWWPAEARQHEKWLLTAALAVEDAQ